MAEVTLANGQTLDSLFIEQAVGHFQDVRPGIGLMVLHLSLWKPYGFPPNGDDGR
jgi:hypothetical protein